LVSGLVRSKVKELEFANQFLLDGWEVFLPLVDENETDMVVTKGDEFYRIQIKREEPDKVNLGQITNSWKNPPIFDFLVFYVTQQDRGFILPKQVCQKSGNIELLNKNKEIKETYQHLAFKKSKFTERFRYIVENRDNLVKGVNTIKSKH